MYDPIPDADLPVLLAEAKAAADRLRRRLGLPAHREDDLRQELLADLIRRLRAFDPARGSLGAFAGTIMRNHSSRIATRVMRERRAAGGAILSLDAITADGTSLGDRLTDEDGLSAWQGGSADRAMTERRIDVALALRFLATSDRAFCAAVSQWSVDQTAERGFGSRAGLYRRLRELRSVLTAYGLQAA